MHKDSKDDNNKNRLFDNYESNSGNFHKIFVVLIVFGSFFLLTAVFPYFSNIFDQNQKKMQIENEEKDIQKTTTDIDQLKKEISDITNHTNRVTGIINKINSSMASEIKKVKNLLAEADKLIIQVNDPSVVLKLRGMLNKTQYKQNATLQAASVILQTFANQSGIYKNINSSLSNQLSSKQKNKNDLEQELGNDNNRTKALAGSLYNLTLQWNKIQTPYGNLPIDFTNLLAIFPLSIVGGFAVCGIFLTESIRLRRVIYYLYDNKQGVENSIKDLFASLWIDPIDPDKNNIKIMQLSILLFPFVLFLLAVFMISYSWQYAPKDPFPAANDVSKDMYYILYALGIVIFVYIYWHIISKARSKCNISL